MQNSELESWQQDQDKAVSYLIEGVFSEGDKTTMRRFFVEEQRVFEFESVDEERLVAFVLAMHKTFGVVSEIVRLEVATRLFRLTGRQFVKMCFVLHKEAELSEILRAEIAARLATELTATQTYLLHKWFSDIDTSSSSAVDSQEVLQYMDCIDAQDLVALVDIDIAIQELIKKPCPSENVAKTVISSTRKVDREKFSAWASQLGEFKFVSASDALAVLWVFTGDAQSLERQVKRLVALLPAETTKTGEEAKEAVELLTHIANRKNDRLWRAVKPIYQWLATATQASEVDVAAQLLKLPGYPEIPTARIQRLVQAHGPLDAEALVSLAKTGSFSEDYWRRHTEFVTSDACVDLQDAISVFYACATSLVLTGDLAWVGMPAERFHITGGFSEDQRLEHYETTFRFRDVVRKLQEISRRQESSSAMDTKYRVRLLWALAATRIKALDLEELVGEEISDLSGEQEVEWTWAWTMLRGGLPISRHCDWKKFPDTDLLNFGFAAVAGSSSEMLRVLDELERRSGNFKAFALQPFLRLLHFARHLRNVEIGNFSQKVTDHNKRILEKREFARRPMWRQAMQASLGTHGIFMTGGGSSHLVEVQAAVAMVFPVDAVVKVKTGVIGLELDRPLSFLRDVSGRRVGADLYTLMARELISLYKLENSSITPLKLINIKLDKWAGIPASDIPKQLEFLKTTIRQALNL